MSCLTRNMQKKLCRYIKAKIDKPGEQSPEALRDILVSQGVCPSSVTVDQLSLILRSIH